MLYLGIVTFLSLSLFPSLVDLSVKEGDLFFVVLCLFTWVRKASDLKMDY